MKALDYLRSAFGGGAPEHGAFDVIVIGSGHNGLTCASYLAKAGRRVLVLESDTAPGGSARSGLIGQGVAGSRLAHLLRGLDAGVVSDLGLTRYGLSYAQKAMDTVGLDRDGAHIIIGGNPLATAETIRPHSPADAEAWAGFHKRMGQFAAMLNSWNRGVPGRLRGLYEGGLPEDRSADARALDEWGDRFAKLPEKEAREFSRLFVSSAGDMLDRVFESDFLKGLLAFDGILGRNAGPWSPGTALGMLQTWSGEAGSGKNGISQLIGGTGALTEALIQSVVARKGQIRCDAKVTRILVEDNRTVGVELEIGERIFAPQVVSGTDARRTLLKMLGQDRMETRLTEALESTPDKGVTAKLNLILDRMPRVVGFDYGHAPSARYVIAPGLDALERSFQPSKYGRCANEPVIELIFPTLADPTLVSHNEVIVSISAQYAPYDLEGGWETGREDFIQKIIDVVSNYMSDLRDNLIGGELLTPVDLENEFGLAGGHWHHGGSDLGHQFMLRPAPGIAQYLGPVQGLYLCGSGSHPGGGITGLAGRNAALRMLKDKVEPLGELRTAHKGRSAQKDEDWEQAAE